MLIGICFFAIMILFSGCNQIFMKDENSAMVEEYGRNEELSDNHNHELSQDSNQEKLDVFLVGDAVYASSLATGEESVFYTTNVSLGEFDLPNTFGETGFVFYESFKEYEKQTGIKLQLHWFPYPENLEAEMEKLSPNEMPDVILSNFTSMADYNLLMKNGVFYDLSAFTEEEGLYTERRYYEQVLKAGQYNGNQYILPIMFNIDTIMGADEIMEAAGIYLDEVSNHTDFMNILIRAQKEKQPIQQIAGQFVSAMVYYTPYMLYDAAGEKWINYENDQVALDEMKFNQMAEFYRNFVQEQSIDYQNDKESWSRHNKHLDGIMSTGDSENPTAITELLIRIGCILEGGSGLQSRLHSAAAQARYYESRYGDMGYAFTLKPLPTENGGTKAQVSYFGGVVSTTDQPKESYNFLRFLMDEEWFYHAGMSVNIVNNEKQLENLANEEYTIYSNANTHPGVDGQVNNSTLDYQIHPMSEKTKEQLLDMIEHIDQVSLPNWIVYMPIREQLERYSFGEITLEEAYQNAVEGLNQYLKDAM